MRGFTKSEFVMSILCNSFTILWAVVYGLVDFFGNGNVGAYLSVRLVYLIAVVFGAALPIALTVALGIHTERYLAMRAAGIVLAVVVLYSVLSVLASEVMMLIYGIGICTAEILFEVLKVQDEATIGRERAVLFLSNPMFYWIIEQVWSSTIYFMITE